MVDILEKELCYKIQGSIYNVYNKYGVGFKEIIYQKALGEEFTSKTIFFEAQKRINIYSFDSGKILGAYIPDFVIENKVIVELKASEFTTKKDVEQQKSYLKVSEYEIAYLVNFGTAPIFIKRIIYTNNLKPFLYSSNSFRSIRK